MIDLSKLQIYPEGGRSCYYYPNYFIVKEYFQREGPWALKNGVMALFKDRTCRWFLINSDFEEFDFTLNKFLKDGTLKKLEDYITKIKTDIVKKLEVDMEALSSEQLSSLARFYYDSYGTIMFAAGNLRNVDRAAIPKLKKVLGEELLSNISVSDRNSFSLQEEIELLKAKNDKELEQVSSRFAWSVRGYYNEESKTIDDYKKALQKIKNPEAKLKEVYNRIKKDLAKRDEILSRLKPKEKKLAMVSAESVYMKDYYKSSINEMMHYAEQMFKEISKRTGRSIDFIKDLLPEETKALIEGKEIDEDLVLKRVKCSLLICRPDSFNILIGEEALEVERKYLSQFVEERNEWKGRIACKGKAVGKAKVVLGNDEFHKVETGDILIVLNTNPDYVPIMQKAAAIVAEEGGLTAHVSVLSREFRIPCIVGIAAITKMIKDGDEVEVNANHGIVRKIK